MLSVTDLRGPSDPLRPRIGCTKNQRVTAMTSNDDELLQLARAKGLAQIEVSRHRKWWGMLVGTKLGTVEAGGGR
jgi:hypothetical protein